MVSLKLSHFSNFKKVNSHTLSLWGLLFDKSMLYDLKINFRSRLPFQLLIGRSALPARAGSPCCKFLVHERSISIAFLCINLPLQSRSQLLEGGSYSIPLAYLTDSCQRLFRFYSRGKQYPLPAKPPYVTWLAFPFIEGTKSTCRAPNYIERIANLELVLY